MELALYDTLTRAKRPFTPIDPARVRMYVCGPTVYDFAHIGNARPVIVFDVLFRLLRHIYGPGHVTYVRNVTDVDDKINARAAERGISIRDLTEETYKNFKQDVAALGCLEPTFEPRATEYVSKPDAPTDMVRLIAQLIKNGCAYAAEGHVLFHVASMKDYGKLSNRSLDEMLAGARVEVAPYKKDPMDFVLWKPSPPDLPGWESPWGRGRPGWHIECTAMSAALLGETFDIHGGGIDLVFPHHENEIAQSRCAFHTPVMANYWMHNGFLQVEGEKMSKSTGNFVTIHELLENYPGGAIRFAMLQSHYRQPINWTADRLYDAKIELSAWLALVSKTGFDEVRAHFEKGIIEPDARVVESLADDLNTPAAITRLRELYNESKDDRSVATELFSNCCFLGLVEPKTMGAFLPGAAAGATLLVRFKSVIEQLKAAHANRFEANEAKATDFLGNYGVTVEFRKDGYPILTAKEDSNFVQALIDKRNAARAAKDWKESDRIRDELAAMGVVLNDGKDGTTWEIAR